MPISLILLAVIGILLIAYRKRLALLLQKYGQQQAIADMFAKILPGIWNDKIVTLNVWAITFLGLVLLLIPIFAILASIMLAR